VSVSVYVLTKHATHRLVERNIDQEWVSRTLLNPQKVEPDLQDPDICSAFAVIPERNNQVLRVVYNPSTNPVRVLTAHFDRRMKGKL
jgi:Domain of unknown function (DUF4258)